LDRGLYASIGRGSDGLMFMAAQRSARAGDYDLAEIGALRKVVPHLRRSYRTWLRIRKAELQRQTALEAMEHVTLGIALVDDLGKLYFANRAAEAEISYGALTVTNGRLTCRSPQSAKALQEAVRAAARQKRPVAERVMLQGYEQDSSMSSVLVTPVRDEALMHWHRGNLAMLLISGPSPKATEETSLRDTYRLTSAEARLLAALVDGERLPAYAQRHGIAITTAKTHLKALFDKVGERRQADLIRRAVGDPFLQAKSRSSAWQLRH
jgi:DNA-binding CsgD family transcriptional regulator